MGGFFLVNPASGAVGSPTHIDPHQTHPLNPHLQMFGLIASLFAGGNLFTKLAASAPSSFLKKYKDTYLEMRTEYKKSAVQLKKDEGVMKKAEPKYEAARDAYFAATIAMAKSTSE